MSKPLISLDGVRLTFGGDPVFEDATMIVRRRARIAVVGRNGSGKSTLMKILAGLIEPDAGARLADPRAKIAYLSQTPEITSAGPLGEYLVEDSADAETVALTRRLADEAGLDLRQPTARLSGGEARRAALVRTLAGAPDLLLLDEPTNHLDIDAIEWLEATLTASTAGIVLISHDRRFLESLSEETVWVDRGRTVQVAKEFSEFEDWRDAALEEEARTAHKLERKIAREEDWLRYGVTARRRRNVRRLAELDALRREKRESRRPTGEVRFSVSAAGASSARVIRAERISKSFDDRPIVRDFSTEIARGDRVALVGPNGAGKSTLLSMLIGRLAPDAGMVRLGESVDLAVLDQGRTSLDPKARLADAITDGRGDWVEIGGARKHVASYLGDFLFAPEQFRSPVGALSGGEQARLALAAILARPSNLLVLDEPTNDLDLETLDLLEELLADYPGTVLLVSHDRSFLDRVATSVIAPDPEGRPGEWVEYAGGYSDMIAQRGGAPARVVAAQKQAAKSKPRAPAAGARKPEKLSFKEKYALEQLPGRIETLEEEIRSLKTALADPGLFARDAAAFNRKAADLEAAEKDLAAAEEEWLTLEMKRETLEG